MAKEITFVVEKDEDSGWLVAGWDDPAGGGITTQGQDLADLQKSLKEAVHCHFDAKRPPRAIRLHFVNDPVLLTA
jgi:predicted RNase H-like HicB family nuclease